MYESYNEQCHQYDLYHLSLRFRILRQHGFHVPCDDFKKLKDEKGGFNGCVGIDVRGILSLYEASHVGTNEDDIVDEALVFTTSYLKSIVDELTSPLAEQVAHALHQPLHKGITRLESKHYIRFYEQQPFHNKNLLNFAKLDFNFLQQLHQQELCALISWWRSIHAKLPFSRDRVMEGYFWSLGCYYEPQYSLARKIFTKLFMIVQVFDDLFDAYGTIDELELLTETVNRWDPICEAQLPEGFNAPYQALHQTFDEVEQHLAPHQKSFLLDYVKEKLKHCCQAWLREVKWRHKKYIPMHEEYKMNAVISVGQIIGIAASYLGMGKFATKQAFDWVCQDPMPTIVDASHVILRLMNDIGGHKFEQTREHVASSIECYIKQYGNLDEEKVYEALENQVKYAWKDTNQGMLRPYDVPKPLLDRIINLSRMPDVMYKGRSDGYTIVNHMVKHNIAAVLIHPIY